MATGPSKQDARSPSPRRRIAWGTSGMACLAGWLTLASPAVAQLPHEVPQTTVRIMPGEPTHVPRPIPPQYLAPLDSVPDVAPAPRPLGPPEFILAEIEAAGAAFDPTAPLPDVSNLRETVLLPMVMQERMLLVDLGPRHPQILAIRARIEALEEYLRQQSAVQAVLAAKAKEAADIEADKKERQAEAERSARERDRRAAERLAAEAAPLQPAGEWPTEPRPMVRPYGGFQPDAIDDASARGDEIDRDVAHRHLAAAPVATSPSSEQRSIFDSIVLPFVSIVAACIVGLLLHVLAAMWFLRRNGAKLSPLFRVELIGGEMTARVAPSTRGHGVDTTSGAGFGFAVPPPPPEDAEEDLGPIDSLKLFDPGPSYEEERQMKEESARQQEEAVLRNIFEQNLTLRQQITELQPDAA